MNHPNRRSSAPVEFGRGYNPDNDSFQRDPLLPVAFDDAEKHIAEISDSLHAVGNGKAETKSLRRRSTSEVRQRIIGLLHSQLKAQREENEAWRKENESRRSEIEAARQENKSRQFEIEAARQENERCRKENLAQKRRIEDLELSLQNLGQALPRLSGVSGFGGNRAEQRLSEDTFSIMMVSPTLSIPMAFALTVFATQITLFCLVASNVIDRSSYNPVGIPSNVDFSVRFTQIIAILIAVATQEDIRTAMLLAYDGYRKDYFDPYFGRGTVSIWKWACSIICRMLEGGLGLVVTFFLIVRSETVVDLLLNFTAMEFVSQLDDVAFFVSQQGFVGQSNQRQATTVTDTWYESSKGAPNKRKSRAVLLVILLASLLVGWGIVVHQQTSGYYVCSVIHVQFSDEFHPSMGAFSGLYDKIQPDGFSLQNHVMYVERLSGRAKFAYCRELEAWTFVSDEKGVGIKNIDPCDWRVKSEKTISYDITTAATSEWVVRIDAREGPLQFFRLSCYDCDKGGHQDGACRGWGECIKNECHCNEGSYGLRCEFQQPCASLEIDARADEFRGNRDWATQFDIMTETSDTRIVEVYDRPVYLSKYRGGKYEIIMFLGRRWVVTDTALLGIAASGDDSHKLKMGLIDHLSHFHARFSKYTVAFISHSMDVDTPTDAATPVGMEWFRAKTSTVAGQAGTPAIDQSRPLEAVLLCAHCDNTTNPCFFQGTCSIDGTCYCTTGSTGVLCQVPPLGNGHCDHEIFNEPEFSYDNGDCCPETCQSSAGGICGKDHTGYADVGYFFCHEPKNRWIKGSQPVTSISGRQAKSGYAVGISATGTILVVAEPAGNLIRVFDKDGSKWVQRGQALEGPLPVLPGQPFGKQIAISKGAYSAVSTPTTPIPFVMLVRVQNGVLVYECIELGCNVVEEVTYDSSNGSNFGEWPRVPYFAVSGNGSVLAIYDPSIRRIVVYHQLYSTSWKKSSFIPIRSGTQDSKNPLHISLSRSGDLIAVVHDQMYSDNTFAQVYSQTYHHTSPTLLDWEPRGAPILLWTTWKVKLVKLSGDGMVLAVGHVPFGENPSNNERGVQLFIWAGEDWEKRGSLLVVPPEAQARTIVDLSYDGSIVVLGPNFTPQDGACAFRWNGTEYKPMGNCLEGIVQSFSLSEDGTALAVGIPAYSEPQGYAGGITRVYHFPRTCPAGWSLVRVSLTMDDSGTGSIMSWEIRNETSTSKEILLKGGPYVDNVQEYGTFADETCLNLQNECYTFNMFCSIDSGMKPPAGFRIIVDGTVRITGGDTWDYGTIKHHLGKCQTSCPAGTSLIRALFRQDPFFFGEYSALQMLQWHVVGLEESIWKGGPYQEQTAAIEQFCIPSMTGCASLLLSGNPACPIPLASSWLNPAAPPPTMGFQIYVDGNLVGNATNQRIGCEDQSLIPLVNCDTTGVATEAALACSPGSVLFTIAIAGPESQDFFRWTVTSCDGKTILGTSTLAKRETCIPQEVCSFDIFFELVTFPESNDEGLTYQAMWDVTIASQEKLTIKGLTELVQEGEECKLGGVCKLHVAHQPVELGDCKCQASPSLQPLLPDAGNITTVVAVQSTLTHLLLDKSRDEVMRREPSKDETEGVLAMAEVFYSLVFARAFSNFVGCDLLQVNATTNLTTSSFPRQAVQIMFDANVTFAGDDGPSWVAIKKTMLCANYTEYVQNYAWYTQLGPPHYLDFGQSLFYYTETAYLEDDDLKHAGLVWDGFLGTDVPSYPQCTS